MRKIAFGYSNRCNLKCGHCVAADGEVESVKMDLLRAKKIIKEMAFAGIGGISFTAGEPFLYLDDLKELLNTCRQYDIYTRVVTNCYWATTRERAEEYLDLLRGQGLCQLRISCSRWHQQQVPKEFLDNAARACRAKGLAYFVSFVTDFSEEDDALELFLREKKLIFFPEPVIYSGRADSLRKTAILTDYQENRCQMNPYLAPDLSVYGCCDSGAQFSNTDFFYLGSLKTHSIDQLLKKSEQSPLYNCIRNMGITTLASFAGLKAREIITYRKCDLCRKLFDDAAMVSFLQQEMRERLPGWTR